MVESLFLATVLAASLLESVAAEASPEQMSFTADRIAVDNVTKAAVASGHVVAVSAPYEVLAQAFGFTVENVLAKARELV